METIVRRIGLVAHDAMKKDTIEWVPVSYTHLDVYKRQKRTRKRRRRKTENTCAVNSPIPDSSRRCV